MQVQVVPYVVTRISVAWHMQQTSIKIVIFKKKQRIK